VSTLRIADALGRVLGGQYRLIRPLGSGASAYVYVAEDVAHRRRVAVKVLHPGLADDQAFLRRFREETRIVAALQHPNILRVYDSGEDGGSPYVVSELLEGGSLRALLDRGHRLTPSQATVVGLSAARALQHAGSLGLVHRDIKPANLLFDRDGRLYVADFGLARALAEAAWTEPARAVIGAARYASPEQARGETVDSRADVYALALVLTEATTDTVPFASDTTLGTLMARIARPLEAPDEAGPLGPILEAAGTIDPGDRLDPQRLILALEGLMPTLPAPDPLPLAGLPDGEPEGDTNLPRVVEDTPGFVHQPPAVPVEPLRAAQLLTAWRTANDPPPSESDIEPGADDDGEPTVAWRLVDDHVPRRAALLYDGADDWEVDRSRPPGNGAHEAGAWGPGVEAAPNVWGREAGEDVSAWSPPVESFAPETQSFESQPPAWSGADDHLYDDESNVYVDQGNAYDNQGNVVDDEIVDDYDDGEVRGRRRWLVWLGAAVLLFVLSGGGTAAWIVTHRPVVKAPAPPPLAVVPTLRGDTVGKARRILVREHLVLVVAGRSYDAHAPSGTIIGGQAPGPGRRVRREHHVAVTVSRGPRPVDVPSLQHFTRYKARRVLAAVGLKIGKITRTTSITVPVNDIISTSPTKGTLLPGQAVAIVISTGKPKVAVPLLQGKTVDSYAAAAAALKALHFMTTEELVYNSTVPAGEVIVTDPLPHASVLYGTTVTVLVSKGPDLVQVPNVQNDTVAKADQTLAAYGFVVSGVTGSPNGTVIGTDPPADSLKLYGSSIQIITHGHRTRRK
jgi:serine/threonine protein kinase/beta-lactam-binding protein with PASTA domain